MSQSPDISFVNGSETTGKKRKINNNTSVPIDMSAQPESPSQGSSSHAPKRGARACTNCRRGKNRCEGEVRFSHLGYDRDPFCSLRPASPFSGPARHLQPPCKRCQQSGTPCIFEKPEKKNIQGLSNGGLESVQTYLSCQVVLLTLMSWS